MKPAHISAFLPEVIVPKRCRRLLVAAVLHACEDEHDDSDDIWKDLVELGRYERDRYAEIHDHHCSEQY